MNQVDPGQLPLRAQGRLTSIDRKAVHGMQRIAVSAVRLSFVLIFVWCGLLEPLGLSPADPLVIKTVGVLPLFGPEVWLSIIGWWEVAIGLTFLHRTTVRIGLVLLAMHMVGTFLPLFIAPEATFQSQHGLYAPTLQGQYVFKNCFLISGAIVVGGALADHPVNPSSTGR